METQIQKMLENVRQNTPLVHCITNYVTANDCANALLAIGASPIMSDDIDDVMDITAICDGLNINIGTLNSMTVPAMLESGKISQKLGHKILLDPVGAGASQLRTKVSRQLINEIKFSVIKGNISEIKALALGIGNANGVDANIADTVSESTINNAIALAKEFSASTGAVIVITGAIDIIASSQKSYIVRNGNPMMSKITGTGCMLGAIMTAFICANPNDIEEACLAAVCTMGICGEMAFDYLSPDDGNAAYRNKIIDGLYNLKSDTLKECAKFEVR